MLVLTRRLGDEIVIGDDIRLTVIRIEGTKVRLGILAPKSVPVRRVELCLRPSKVGVHAAPAQVALAEVP